MSKKKIIIRLAIVAGIFLLSLQIFSNWEDFKNGLLGKPPIESNTPATSDK